MGIEPTFSAWEADVLPLNYTRFKAGHSLPDSPADLKFQPSRPWGLGLAGGKIRRWTRYTDAQKAMIELTVNGERRRVAPGITVAQLIDALQLTGKRIALEKNGEIVPRSRFGEERLMEGDRLEIVVAVGGG